MTIKEFFRMIIKKTCCGTCFFNEYYTEKFNFELKKPVISIWLFKQKINLTN